MCGVRVGAGSQTSHFRDIGLVLRTPTISHESLIPIPIPAVSHRSRLITQIECSTNSTPTTSGIAAGTPFVLFASGDFASSTECSFAFSGTRTFGETSFRIGGGAATTSSPGAIATAFAAAAAGAGGCSTTIVASGMAARVDVGRLTGTGFGTAEGRPGLSAAPGLGRSEMRRPLVAAGFDEPVLPCPGRGRLIC